MISLWMRWRNVSWIITHLNEFISDIKNYTQMFWINGPHQSGGVLVLSCALKKKFYSWLKWGYLMHIDNIYEWYEAGIKEKNKTRIYRKLSHMHVKKVNLDSGDMNRSIISKWNLWYFWSLHHISWRTVFSSRHYFFLKKKSWKTNKYNEYQ